MASQGRPPKTHSYNSWNVGDDDNAEKIKQWRRGGTMDTKTSYAIAELNNIQNKDEFVRVTKRQREQEERRDCCDQRWW